MRARLASLLLVTATALHAAPARADRVDELAVMLSTSSSDKARLSAVAALAKLGDRRALKPLVAALHDPSAQVRAVSAAALGKLGHRAALPALHTASTDDSDATVRARAREAAIAVAKANGLSIPSAVPTDPAVADQSASGFLAPTGPSSHGGSARFGRQGHAVAEHAELYVLINSSADDSPGKADKAMRKTHGDILKAALADQLKNTPVVTSVAADAQRWGLDPRHIDLSVTKLALADTGNIVEMEAQIRLAISDDSGKMLSFVSGGAKVQVAKRTFDPKYLPQLRKEALENAMRGMFDKLLAHLRQQAQS